MIPCDKDDYGNCGTTTKTIKHGRQMCKTCKADAVAPGRSGRKTRLNEAASIRLRATENALASSDSSTDSQFELRTNSVGGRNARDRSGDHGSAPGKKRPRLDVS